MPHSFHPDDTRPVALVTGSGAPRIGNCVARTLAARGYRLALHTHWSLEGARETARELEAAGTEAMVVPADVRHEDAVRTIVRQVHEHFGRIDALVNCAGVWEKKRLEEVAAADVMHHFEVNALGTFLCCQQVGLIMVDQPGGGAIVNVGDWATVRPYVDYAAYFPSKGAIPALTRMFAVELARRNPRVRVNAVLPGPVLLSPDLTEAERQEAIAGTLVKHEGNPQNIADAVAFLLANDFVTGVCLPVDGGRSIYC